MSMDSLAGFVNHCLLHEDMYVTNEMGFLTVAEKRKSYTKKMERIQTNISEIFKYISAEIRLLDENRQRYDEQFVDPDTDRKGIAVLFIIADRINRMYAYVFRHFAYNMYHVKSYLWFYTTFERFITKNEDSFYKLISQKHEPKIYIMAAKFMFYSKSDILTARRYFKYGMSYYANYRPLYIADFGVEVQMMIKSNGNTFQIALKKYKDYTERFKGDFKFFIKLLDKMFDENKVNELQIHMIRDMIEEYKENEETWKKLSKINYNGFIYDYDTGELEYDEHCKRKIQNSFDAFENGIKANESPEKQIILWKSYAEHIINVRNHVGVTNDSIETFMVENMKRVFQHAHDIQVLPKEYYVYWAEFSIKEHDPVLVERAVELNKGHVNPWCTIMAFFLKFNSFDMAYRIINDSIRALKVNSLHLWRMMSQTIEKTKDKQMIEEFYDKAMNCQFQRIRVEFLVQYFKWYQQTEGVTATRKMFKTLKESVDASPDLYRAMIFFETCSSSKNHSFINKIHVEMCTRYSKNDTGLWIEGMKHDYSQGRYGEAEYIYKCASSVLDEYLMRHLQMFYERLKLESKVQVIHSDGSVKIFEPDEN